MSCLKTFNDKDVYTVSKEFYYVLYCMDCIKEKGITEYKSYVKSRKKKE
jgi:hypothetical protein